MATACSSTNNKTKYNLAQRENPEDLSKLGIDCNKALQYGVKYYIMGK